MEELVLMQKFFLYPKENWLIQAFIELLDKSRKLIKYYQYPTPLYLTSCNLACSMENIFCQV